MTVVDAVAVLLDESGSEVEELTEAVLVMVPPSLGAVTRIVMGGAAPGGRVLARVQATLVLVPLQVQPAPLAPWKVTPGDLPGSERRWLDRKSTRLNSSHSQISYAVFCLKKKKQSTGSHQSP